jgi:hypothetical protein
MSHATYTYPIRTGGLTLASDNPNCVREDETEYRTFRQTFIQYIDLLNEKLPKERAIISLMEADERNMADGVSKQANLLAGVLVDDIALASKALEAEYYRSVRRDEDK